jgi:hypothetical protein
MPFYLPNNASCNENPMAVGMNINAIPAQALPPAATPRQATETAVFDDYNTIARFGDHGSGTDSAQWHTGVSSTLKHQVAASEALYAIEEKRLTTYSLNGTLGFFGRLKHLIPPHVCPCAIETPISEECSLNGKLDFPVG